MENKKVMLKNVRASYVTLDEPRAITEGGDLFYSVSLIVEKNNPAIAEYKKIVDEIATEQKWQGKKFDKGIRDGNTDRPDDEAYKDMFFFNAKSRRKVLVLGKDRREIDPLKIYSGCYVNASISVYPYDKAGNKGVGIGLRGIQFAKDGDPLGSTVSADEFEALEEDSAVDDWLE